jgi:signal transduction histidine kinase
LVQGAAIIVVVLAAIVGLSMSSATVEQERLLSEYTAEIRQQVHASADALSRLDSIHQDMQMLVNMVERSRRHPDSDEATEHRVWESAFRALAVVVVHYRIIALVADDGTLEVEATDPNEEPATVRTLLPHVRQMRAGAWLSGAERLGSPVRIGERSFLFYGTPVGGGGTIVVVSDAALLLRSVAWPQVPSGVLFVTDPAGVAWSECETARGCRLDPMHPAPVGPAVSTRAPTRVEADEASQLGLSRSTAVRVSEEVARPAGHWTVTWIASTQALDARERSILSRIATTAVAAAIAVALVAFVWLRQQRRTAALADELRYAKAQAEARELENQLVRADRLVTVGVMAAEIAHEIGTPLSVVRGRAEQVLPALDGGVLADDLRVMIKQVDHISGTIRQLLDFARRAPLDQRPVPLEAVVERTRELLQLKLEARRLQLRQNLPPDLPMLTADPDQLQQVLVNLLLNACDASPRGGSLSISAWPAPDDMVRIEVGDEGTGIAPEHLQVVFEPFFTTKPRGEGTGLGLSITAGIVRNHAGKIDLRSVPGGGTTVTVLWPASAPTEGSHV